MAIYWTRRTYTEQEFVDAWKSSYSIAEVARKLDCNKNGSGYSTLKRAAKELNLSSEHMTGQGHLRGKTHEWGKRLSVEEVFVKGSNHGSSYLKKRLYQEGICKPVCSACGITEWLGNPAPLALDHIDGDKTNNILENLRILCYNCHGLTETFCRGNREKKKPKNNVKRCACGKQLQYSNKTGMCLDCYVASGTKTQKLHDSTHLNRDRIDWPSDEDLVKMVKDTNFSATGRALNVSRVAVRERCKRRGLVID